jgi:hypothetical protein
MRILTLCLILIALPGAVSAATIVVGGTEIEIPSPSNFSEVTPQMATLYEVQKLFVASMNVEYLAFIPDKDVSTALRDELPELERRFTVQTAKSLVNLSVTRYSFEELKQVIKTQNDEIVKKAEAAIGQSIETINKNITGQYDVDLALSVSQMIPLPAHAQTERSLAYSAFVKYNINDEAGNPSSFVAAMTVTFVHVKGKVLFLYSYAEESGLDWSRNLSTQWSNAVIEANPSDLQSSINEMLPAAVTGIDWGEVGVKALIGAFIGLVIGFVSWLAKRGKTS